MKSAIEMLDDIKSDPRNIDFYLNQLRVKVTEMDARITELEEFIRNAPVSSGVCCCGDSMDTHDSGMYSGHSPVDQWDYSVMQILGASK